MSALTAPMDVWAGVAGGSNAVSEGPDVWAALGGELDVAAWRPVIAADVEVASFPFRDGGAEVIAHNPRARRYYRLQPNEAALLPLMDGSRTVADLVAEELSATGDLDAGAVGDLVRVLHVGGYLVDEFVDTGAALERAVIGRRGRRRALLVTSLRTMDVGWAGADRLMRWLYQRLVRHLFNRVAGVMFALVAVGGAVAFGTVAASGRFEVTPQSLGWGIVALFALDAVTVAIHETGHAMVLIREGRRLNGAGIRLYFGMPAFYIESSDALMLGRRKRMLQAFAGPWFEAVATGVVALALWAAPGAAIAPLLYRFCALGYFVVLLNLVPLLELDGYWILSDGLRIRDLRARSLAFVRRGLWHKLRRRQGLTRAETGLALYGTAGVAFTILAVTSAVTFWQGTFGGPISRLWHGGPVGILLLGLITVVVAGPILSAAAASLRSLAAGVRRTARRIRFRTQRSWRVEAAQLLDHQPFFADLPANVLNQLAGVVTLRPVGPGHTVVRQGDRSDAYFLVRRGTFQVVEEDGPSERLLRTIGPGQSFGEMGPATGAARNATVRAVTEGELFAVSRSAFERLLRDRTHLTPMTPTYQHQAELRAITCFAHLGPDELADLLRRGQWLTPGPGTDIVTQGEPGDAFYAVGSGRLEVIQDGHPIRQLKPNDFFGEVALLHDVPRVATVRTLTSCRLFRLDTTGFDAVVRNAFASGRVVSNPVPDHTWQR